MINIDFGLTVIIWLPSIVIHHKRILTRIAQIENWELWGEFMHFGFSYIGLMFLIMLIVPNLFLTKNQPKDYEKYVHNESKILLLFERVGEVLVTCCCWFSKILTFKAFLHGWFGWLRHLCWWLCMNYTGYGILKAKRRWKIFTAV